VAKKPTAPPRPPGRPTKCTPETVEAICNALRDGLYAVTAARLAKIDEVTLYRWLEQGEKGVEPYAAFRQSVKEAEAKAEQDALKTARAGATGTEMNPGPHWTSAMTFLERRWPDRWGKRDPQRAELSELEKKCKQLEIETAEAKLALLKAGTNIDAPTLTVIVPGFDVDED
jgi:transposase